MRNTCLLFLLAACGDNSISVVNSPPEVTILDPAPGTTVPEGLGLILAARITDDVTTAEELELTVISDRDGALTIESTWVDDQASLAIPDSLSLGPHTLELSAFDGSGASGSDSLAVVVEVNAPPTISIEAPVNGTRYPAELPLTIRARVGDDFDNPDEVALTWSGVAGLSTQPTSAGVATADVFLTPGLVDLEVIATDSLGLSTSTRVSFEMVDGDGDNDGEVSTEFGGADCDDEEASVGPGFIEICDGMDNDCDSFVDEDTSDSATYFRDDDLDGFGDAEVTSTRCAAELGWVLDNTDCDDSLPEVYPGAPELCNGRDDDCSGAPDPDELSDGDTDGSVTCADCNDDDPNTFPGAPEPCDGIDQSCSGFADDGGTCPCEVDWFGGHSYLFCEDGENWGNAVAACADISGYEIVTISTPVENDFLEGVIDTYVDTQWWTGLNDLPSFGTWVWNDGSDLAYTNWNAANNEPNNLTGDEHCLELGWYDDGTWNDAFCGEVQNYICEAELGPTTQ